ncbi:MAG: RNA polymerase sigma factor [Thiotrichales bacterium]
MFDSDTLNRLYRYAYSLTGHKVEAEDLLQDGLERYLRAGQKSVDNPLAYVRRILRNGFIDGLRRKNLHPEIQYSEEFEAQDIDMRTLESIMVDQDLLARIWLQLAPFEREILYFWAVEGMTVQEVSNELGTPRGTILSRIHRLRARLRAESSDLLPASAESTP